MNASPELKNVVVQHDVRIEDDQGVKHQVDVYAQFSSPGLGSVRRFADDRTGLGSVRRFAEWVLGASEDSQIGNDYSSIADRAFDFGTTAKSQQIVLTSDAEVPAPVATQDRMFELQALACRNIEPFCVSNAAGFSVVVVRQAADLTGS